jgi:hypothetical protein
VIVGSVTWLDYLTGVSSLATAGGVFLAWWQLRATKQQAQSAFEDSLTSQYRDIVHTLPLAAMLGERLSPEELQAGLPAFYRYFDLCNEQVFLRSKGRIRADTWREWTEGINQNLSRPAFRAAWREIDGRSDGSFDDLRRLLTTLKLPVDQAPLLRQSERENRKSE